jgi:hypothetical protein
MADLALTENRVRVGVLTRLSRHPQKTSSTGVLQSKIFALSEREGRTLPIVRSEPFQIAERAPPGQSVVIWSFNVGSVRDHIGTIDKGMGRDVCCHRFGKVVHGFAIIARIVRI